MTKFDPTKPVQTRNGRSARIICTNTMGYYPIIALIVDGDNEYPETYTLKGECSIGKGDKPDDLINTSEKGFVNIWEENKDYEVTQQPYATAEKAREAITSSGYKYIAIAVEVDM